MNPLIVIATHGIERAAITLDNIKACYPYGVVLVISDILERGFYDDRENVHVVMAPNEPLGQKWQTGIDEARQMPHSHLVITGSDDILAKGYVEYAMSFRLDFVGLRAWYILHEDKLYLIEYKAPGNIPLGGGRVYSKKFLESIDYQLFDTGKSKLLDNHAWNKASKSRHKLIYQPKILAVKGPWVCMNPVNLSHPNVKLIKTYEGDEMKSIIEKNFDYEV